MYGADEKRQRQAAFTVQRQHVPTSVVFVGHAMMGGSPKGLGPVPVRKMLTEAGKQMAVVMPNEHRTSITCSVCRSHEKMKKPVAVQLDSQCGCGRKFKDKEMKCKRCALMRESSKREVYSAFSCKSCKRDWDRDENASKNIKQVVEAYITGAPRPPHLVS